MSQSDGGSAFPEIRTGFADEHGNAVTDVYSEGGMSLRDYFACAALQAMGTPIGSHWSAGVAAGCAQQAYQIADAMLKERAK